jgi:hypothetical protein
MGRSRSDCFPHRSVLIVTVSAENDESVAMSPAPNRQDERPKSYAVLREKPCSEAEIVESEQAMNIARFLASGGWESSCTSDGLRHAIDMGQGIKPGAKR